jgi:hypothetical protein
LFFDFRMPEGQGEKHREPWEVLQPKLTMLGVAFPGPTGSMSESELKEAMATAAMEFEEQIKGGEAAATERGPLFIADLGDGLSSERDLNQSNGWEGEENEH